MSAHPGAADSRSRSATTPRSSTLRYYCPSCWQAVAETNQACPRCGTDPDSFSEEPRFEAKLLRALIQPDRITARRAAWLLGERRCSEAAAVFEQVLDHADLYLLLAIVEAAGKLQTDRATELLRRLAEHDDPIVGGFAAQELAKVTSGVRPE